MLQTYIFIHSHICARVYIIMYTFTPIHYHIYIGGHTCTHKEFLYSLILYLYAYVSSTVQSAPSFSHVTSETNLSPLDVRKYSFLSQYLLHHKVASTNLLRADVYVQCDISSCVYVYVYIQRMFQK